MKLLYSPTSPYVRKVMVCAHELGLADRLEIIPKDVWDPSVDISDVNPLGKVPSLILDDGHVLFDSPVICEYLDDMFAESVLFPKAGKARWKALYFQALADGILDAGVARLLEGRRDPAEQSEKWKERYLRAVTRAIDTLENEADILIGGPLTIGQVSVACAMGYVNFRMSDLALFKNCPKLSAWYEVFSKRASMVATEPK
jgi:glutathione S-transferase